MTMNVMATIKPCKICGEPPIGFKSGNEIWFSCVNKKCGIKTEGELRNLAIEEWNSKQ